MRKLLMTTFVLALASQAQAIGGAGGAGSNGCCSSGHEFGNLSGTMTGNVIAGLVSQNGGRPGVSIIGNSSLSNTSPPKGSPLDNALRTNRRAGGNGSPIGNLKTTNGRTTISVGKATYDVRSGQKIN